MVSHIDHLKLFQKFDILYNQPKIFLLKSSFLKRLLHILSQIEKTVNMTNWKLMQQHIQKPLIGTFRNIGTSEDKTNEAYWLF